jgi:preprotein translocase subunit SecF
LIHDILVTAGIYSLSGFQVSPDTVVAFLTILGYSLYDTIVVFDRVQENTRGLASTNRLTYTDTVNLSMNQVLARSLNTSLVAILPILSILVVGAWILGATALDDFGLALFVGLTTGAYSSIFIASPLLAVLKEKEPRYAEIRRRLAAGAGGRRITPAAAASGDLSGVLGFGTISGQPSSTLQLDDGPRGGASIPAEEPYGSDASKAGQPTGSIPLRTSVPSRPANKPPPRPRKKGRRR